MVEAEFSETDKTTLRSEWSCVPEKRKERTKNTKNFLTRAGIVRDAWLTHIGQVPHFYSGGFRAKDLNRHVKIPIPQPSAMPKSRSPMLPQTICHMYSHVLTSACIRWAYTSVVVAIQRKNRRKANRTAVICGPGRSVSGSRGPLVAAS